jgi:hypothetical protein
MMFDRRARARARGLLQERLIRAYVVYVSVVMMLDASQAMRPLTRRHGARRRPRRRPSSSSLALAAPLPPSAWPSPPHLLPAGAGAGCRAHDAHATTLRLRQGPFLVVCAGIVLVVAVLVNIID